MPYRFAALTLLALAGAAQAKDLKLQNPGFEEAAKGGNVITGWRASQHAGPPSYEFTSDKTVAAKGAQSLRITRTREQVYASVEQALPAAPLVGATLEFRFQVRSKDVGPLGFMPIISLTNSSDALIEQVRGEPVTGTVDKWKSVSVSVKVPDYVHEVVIGMLLLDGGTVWIDEATLRVTEPAPPAPKGGAKPKKPAWRPASF
jgi:hypothetical protein